MGRARCSAVLAAVAVVLTGCSSGYAWDEDMGDVEQAERVESLLSAVASRTSDAVGSRAAQSTMMMTDDEIVASAASICAGLHDELDTQEIIEETTERVPEFDSAAISIVGPPAVEFLCPELAPQGA